MHFIIVVIVIIINFLNNSDAHIHLAIILFSIYHSIPAILTAPVTLARQNNVILV